jgi:Uma2 family endonuclease
MSAVSTITTAEQLSQAGDIGRCELVRGELVMMSPTNPEHSRRTAWLTYVLLQHIAQHPEQGQVHNGDPGFVIEADPDTVRAPDVALVKQGGAAFEPEKSFFRGAPALAVEVLSPGDTAGETLEKVQQWLEAGTTEVWIVDPDRKTISINSTGRPVRVLRSGEALTCEGILPGFSVPVADIFR